MQKKISNRIKSLDGVDGIKVTSSKALSIITITHHKKHSADFILKWVDGSHYVGYFRDASGKDSQGIISIWNPLEAVKFAALYTVLIDLRAKRESQEG